MRTRSLLLPILLASLVACAGRTSSKASAPPLVLAASAFEAAGAVELPAKLPLELPGLHNVYELSGDIWSGAEPEGEAAFEALARMGVKTILSVDGKAPDGEAAARHGLRYVHVPIRYNGITTTERVAIAKTFRELEGPFYVHCYHGQHRGPAAAALGRLVLDGASREDAIAEMRQYCGTSKKYEGLYRDIASGALPDEATTRASDFDFAPAFRFEGFRGVMVEVSRSFDTLKDLAKGNFEPIPDHPDATAVGEAQRLYEALSQGVHLPEVRSEPEDFNAWLIEAQGQAQQLVERLQGFDRSSVEAVAAAVAGVAELGKTCETCHQAYRN